MKREESLRGKGKRPEDPYVRIIWASMRGHGITLSAKEVFALSFDDAIATVACGMLNKPGYEEN